MSDDTHDDMINLDDPSEYEDPVSQRAMAFCHVAKLADTLQNEAVKELCLTMLRKLNASIRTPSTADLRSIEGGTSSCARAGPTWIFINPYLIASWFCLPWKLSRHFC
jgi:hypothetical protein